MFAEIPSRRISERRKALGHALLALSGVVAGYGEFVRNGHVNWETLIALFMFATGIYSFWKGRLA